MCSYGLDDGGVNANGVDKLVEGGFMALDVVGLNPLKFRVKRVGAW